MKDNDDFMDNFKKHMSGFYKEFQEYENIFRHNDWLLSLQDGAKEYAQLGIKNLLWINGGALVALPAIAEAFDLKINGDITIAAWCFAAGLIAIIVCILLAYFSMTQGTMAVASDRNANYSHFMAIHMQGFYEEETLQTFRDESEKAQTEHEKHQGWATKWEIGAILMGITSLICFIAGGMNFLNSLP